MTAAVIPMSERELQRLVTDALDALGYSWVHIRPGLNRRGHWSTPIAGSLGGGWPDITAVRADRGVLFIECKAQDGRVSDAQRLVHDVLRAAGLDVRIVRPSDVDALIEALR